MSANERRAARSPAAGVRGAVTAWLGAQVRNGLMPFTGARPLTRGERRSVVAFWAVAGGLFGCAWAGAFALVLARFTPLQLALLGLLAALGGAAFFAALALGLLRVLSRSLDRAPPRRPGRPAPP